LARVRATEVILNGIFQEKAFSKALNFQLSLRLLHNPNMAANGDQEVTMPKDVLKVSGRPWLVLNLTRSLCVLAAIPHRRACSA
jgi:hypothetical protein